MTQFFIISGLVLLFALMGGVLVWMRHLAKRGVVTRSLNMSLFLVTLPLANKAEGGQGHEAVKEKISLMEQLLASFSTLEAGGWLRETLYGKPYIALEMAVHHKGEHIHTYIAVPRNMENILEKQVHGFFPHAEVEQVKDYSIFNPGGASAASFAQLRRPSVLPLVTYHEMNADPLNNIATAMSKLKAEGEGVVVQLVLKPVSSKNQQSMAEKIVQEMYKGKSFNEASHEGSGSLAKDVFKEFTSKPPKPEEQQEMYRKPVDEHTVQMVRDKAYKTHFNVNLRLVSAAEDKGRAEQVLSELEAAFAQFNSASGNSLVFKKVPARSMRKFIFDYSFRIPRSANASNFSIDEVVSFYHFPVVDTEMTKMRSLRSKAAPPPPTLPAEGLVLGENVYRGERHLVRISKNDRRRHMYIIGQTGTGKSRLIYNMIKQDIANGEGVALLDPHGDLAHKILEVVPKERWDDIVWFDPGDPSRPFGLNMLEYDTSRPQQKTLVVNELLGIFRKLFHEETMGPMFDQYFRNACLLLLDDYEYEIPTLLDVSRVLTDSEFRSDKLSRETNEVVKNFWEKEAEKAGGDAALANIAPYITSKINGFVSDEFLRPIISHKQSSLNFRTAMDEKKIILVNLSKGKLGELNANLVGLVIVGKLLIASLSRVDIEEETRNDFYLYMDEFQNFSTDSIATILSEARKYHLNLIMAHQFIAQLEDKIQKAVFGNVGSMLALRVGIEDAQFLKEQFEPAFTEEDLSNIDNFKAHAKLLINNQTTRPFRINIS
ncbi:MAG: DUF87 domain-containing protein [Candidatus Spechtbacterales bacterium]